MQGICRTLAVAALFALAAAPAHAQSPSFYLGADLVRFSTKIEDKTGVPPDISGTATTAGFRLKGGIHAIEYLDAELHLVVPPTSTYSNVLTENTAQTTVLGAYAKPNYSFGDLNLYALAGIAAASVKLDGAIVGTQNFSGFSYGLGLQYAFTKNWSASLDYMHYFKGSKPVNGLPGSIDVKGDAFGIGVTYNFR